MILHGGVGKNGSTIAGTSVLSPGLHIGLIIILAIMIYKKSATNMFEKHPCLYTLMFGCVFAKVAQKLVIAHMTKSELYLQDTVFIGPGLLFLDQYFNNFIDEYVVLWIAMVISSFDMMIYFTSLCLQISRHLHLNIFKTSCQQAPEQVYKHIDWLVAQGKEEKQLGEPMCEGYPPIQEASILSIRLCLSIKYKSVASIMSTSIMNPLSLTYHVSYQCNIMYALETRTKNKFKY